MGERRSFSSHHFLQYASSHPMSTSGKTLPGTLCLLIRSGSSAAIPKYCTIFFFAPCAMGLEENPLFELGTPISSAD